MVRGLKHHELGVEVLRRCVDQGELVGVALRDRPRAVVVAAELPWIDREVVGMLQDAGVAVVAVESNPGLRQLEALGISYHIAASTTAEELAGLLHRLAADELEREGDAGLPVRVVGDEGDGDLVAVWGAPGAPGRTTVAVHLAIEHARRGTRVLLVDGDAWAASVAQLLGLEESPAVTNATRLAADGWPRELETCLQTGPAGIWVLPGIARADLWPEIGERAWLGVLDACRDHADLVVVDLAAPIDEDEELAFDRAPYRRNLMTRVALREADRVVLVAAGDPIGLRRGIFAHHELARELPGAAANGCVVVNRAPGSPRRLQDCSFEIEHWTGTAPAALLPVEPAFERVAWEGRPLHEVAGRSTWLRELRASVLVDRPVASTR